MTTDNTDITFPGHSASSLDEASVHRIRKGTKQLRARLQLLRQLEGRHHETEQLRNSVKELAHLLAAQRDADVMADALQDMIARTEDLEVQQLLASLREELKPEPLAAKERKRIHKLISEINRSSKKLDSHKHESAEIDKILDARLAALCAMGRELLQTNDWEALHDWRKQVKKLMYQYQLKTALTPKILFVFEHLSELGSHLGHINDMSILESFVRGQEIRTARAHDLNLFTKVHQLIEMRRQEELSDCRKVFQAIDNLQ